MNALSDEELLRLFREERTRHQAFDQLMRQYQQRLYHFVRRMVNDHDAAQDVLQDSFVKIWHSLPDFRGGSALYSWMYRIVHNQCLDHLRKANRRTFVGTDHLSDNGTGAPDASAHLSSDEIGLLLQQALMRLPDKQRAVFTMRYFDELKYEDMSRITGTSVGALKSSYHIAVKKIEQWLQADRTNVGV
ncbi:MAG: RNA polymerase sigma factor [Flavobacteriales bacterium]|jgi:RNA polymerase sigma-70 factor (ECF subfamily)|nr:RNA polymerase sigma factor [Flavobacteriales bacterium]